jgi:deoxyadenosine/deoxycytidine kinase
VEGSIGAGKTTLSTMLANEFNAELVLERFADNPFLEKFYKDPEHYAFPVEMTFLMDRYQQLKNLLTARDLFTDFVIGDYFIDKCLLFSKNNLAKDEFSLFKKVFDTIAGFLPKPDLILYLYTAPDRLLKQIAKRNRAFEKDITAEYLSDIQEKYLTYFKENHQIPILLVDTENVDFVENPSDYQLFKDLIMKRHDAGIHRILF